ncbi:hypothetical protein XENORESO_005688 [Xenotaenia resolanae]|uniref:Uncharacterized protein n=1 Tax=Xenotaenia resolanae TaxID=208358 RepID=A0ABV0VT18_9TELE
MVFFFSLPNNCFKAGEAHTLLSICCLVLREVEHFSVKGVEWTEERLEIIPALPPSLSLLLLLHSIVVKTLGDCFNRECKMFCHVTFKNQEKRQDLYLCIL